MLAIFKKEMRSFFSSATGYVVISIFLSLTALLLWVIPGEFNVLDSGYANVDGLFYLAPWLFLFLCPAISMRLIAEEKQMGTWELLVAKPITPTQIVVEKYLAGWLLSMMALFPCILYYFSVAYLAEPIGNVDSGSFLGSFIGLVCLSAVYVSIGTFSSSLSHSQIVVFIVAIVLCLFFYYGFDIIANFFSNGESIHTFELLGIHAHYKSISRGVIDSSDIVYFIAMCSVFLWITIWKIKKI